IVCCGLAALSLRIDRIPAALDDIFMEGVFDVRGRVGAAEEPACVRLILGEKELRCYFMGAGLGRETELAQGQVMSQERSVLAAPDERLGPTPFMATAPGPGVAEPECGQQVEHRRLRTAVGSGDPD